MTYNILICDDEQAFVERIEKWLREYHLQRYSTPVQIHTCCDPTNLTDAELFSFDLAILDIDMGKENGIALARRFRGLCSRALIIFLTNYIEFSPAGYEVNAFRFLLKSQWESKLPSYYDAAIAELSRKDAILTFRTNGELLRVPVRDILYLESQRRLIFMYRYQPKGNVCSFYGTINEMETNLSSSGFLRIHKSFLVNMEYIEAIGNNTVTLITGKQLPVSQHNYSRIKMAYINWKCEQ